MKKKVSNTLHNFWTILDFSGPSLTILDFPGPSWTILDNYGSFWTILDNSGPFWTILDILDHSGSFWTTLNHVLLFCSRFLIFVYFGPCTISNKI